MRLIWHVAKKDFRELRGLIAAYSVLIAVKLGLGVMLVRGSAADPGAFARMVTYGNLCAGLELLMGYVVVAAFVHEHPLIGSRAEWMTRPISGGQLLAVKLIGLGVVLIAIPLCLALPWWLDCGYTAHQMQQAALETILRQAVVIVPALALAVLTDGFDRYVIWLLVLFGLGFLASKLPPVQAAISTPDVAETREWLALLIATATALGVVVNQFFTRRTGRGVGVLCLGLVATAVAAWWWPESFERFRVRPAAVSAEIVPAGSVGLAFEKARVVDRTDREPELRVGVAVRGVPPELKLGTAYADQSWSWSGVRIQRRGEMSEESYGTIAPSLRALGLTVDRVDPSWFLSNMDRPMRVGLLGQPLLPDSIGVTVQTALRPAYLGRMKREKPDYDLMARLALFRPEVLGEEPVQLNGKLDRGSDRVRIASVMRTANDAWVITLVESSPAMNFKSPSRYVGTQFAEAGEANEYFLVNRPRGNASRGEELAVQRARFGTILVTWRTMRFSAPREWVNGVWLDVPGWFQNLSLAKIRNRQVATLQAGLHVTAMPLSEEK